MKVWKCTRQSEATSFFIINERVMFNSADQFQLVIPWQFMMRILISLITNCSFSPKNVLKYYGINRTTENLITYTPSFYFRFRWKFLNGVSFDFDGEKNLSDLPFLMLFSRLRWLKTKDFNNSKNASVWTLICPLLCMPNKRLKSNNISNLQEEKHNWWNDKHNLL